MKLGLLFKDELTGFIKSRLMVVLWIGLPALVTIIYYLQPNMEGMPFTSLAALLLASICGSLSGVLLSTTIRSELNAKIYDLFLIRPIKRIHILLSKYLSVITGLTIAVILSLAVGTIIDGLKTGAGFVQVIGPNIDSIVVIFSTIIISGAIGMLIGLLINSVPVSAIVSFYVCNQISGVILVVTMLVKLPLDIKIFSGMIGLVLGSLFFALCAAIFNRKQL